MNNKQNLEERIFKSKNNQNWEDADFFQSLLKELTELQDDLEEKEDEIKNLQYDIDDLEDKVCKLEDELEEADVVINDELMLEDDDLDDDYDSDLE